MIEVNTSFGTFIVEDAVLTTNSSVISSLYSDFVLSEKFGPSDGHEDFAVAKKIVDLLGEELHIVRDDLGRKPDYIY